MERKNLYGYIINSSMVIALGIIYLKQINFNTSDAWWNWISLGLIVVILGMLTTVFFILRAQIKAKKKWEEKLLKSQKLLHSIIDNTTNAISVKKINGEYMLANKKYQSIFETYGKDLLGKTDHDMLPKELADRYLEADLEAMKLGEEIQIEEEIEQSDGKHTYLSVKFPLFDINNRVYAIGSISTDITERKMIMESQKTADTFFNISTDSLVIATSEKFLRVNPSLSNLLGYTKEELLNTPFAAYIFPEDLEKTKEAINKLEEGATLVSFQSRWICKDQSIKWLSWNATSDTATGRLYAVVRDITKELLLQNENEKRMNELYENQQKLNMIIENISDGVLVANTDKQVILANEVANELFGIADDSKISIDFSDHFKVLNPHEGKVFPAQNLPAELALGGKITNDIDVLLMNKQTNEIRRVLLSGRPIIDNENYIAAVVVTIKDISRYKRLEAELKKKDQESRRRIGFKSNQSKKEE